MCSLHVGPGWRGPPVGIRFVVNTWILLLSLWIFPYWHPTIWSVSRMASMHVCPYCVGIWRSLDLEQGFPRMRSLWGRVCVFVSQVVCRFMQWSMIVTDNLVGRMGLAGYIASLWPPRIWFPSLPKANRVWKSVEVCARDRVGPLQVSCLRCPLIQGESSWR